MPAIHETAYPHLKHQPSTDDLMRFYSPTQTERDLAAWHTKGPVARIGFLVMLTTFQRLGSFLRLREVPEPIVAQIMTGVGVPLISADSMATIPPARDSGILWLSAPFGRCAPYDRTVQRLLIRSLIAAAQTKTDLVDVITIGIEELIRMRSELPTFSTLHRLARHARAIVHRGISRQVQATLLPTACRQLEPLLTVDPLTKHTPWTALKRDPGTPTLTHLKALLDHLAGLTCVGSVPLDRQQTRSPCFRRESRPPDRAILQPRLRSR